MLAALRPYARADRLAAKAGGREGNDKPAHLSGVRQAAGLLPARRDGLIHRARDAADRSTLARVVYSLAAETVLRWGVPPVIWGSGGEPLDLRQDLADLLELRLRLEVREEMEGALKGEKEMLLVFNALSDPDEEGITTRSQFVFTRAFGLDGCPDEEGITTWRPERPSADLCLDGCPDEEGITTRPSTCARRIWRVWMDALMKKGLRLEE
jgi:hypothetical protein